MPDSTLILASSSPRRIELLDRLGLEFEVEPADIDESVVSGETPTEYVERLALGKAAASARPGTVVVAADTAVVIDQQILGKPTNSDDAARMLRLLSARSHEVVTGLAVVASLSDRPERTATAVETTQVDFAELSDDRIRWYVESGEPDDKAGAYGLQGAGAIFADRITGSYTNVIGLPLPLLDRLFAEIGFDLINFRLGS